MKPHLAPYAKILTQACDRVFMKPVWLGDELLEQPSHVLHLLSTTPQVYGELKPCHTAIARQEALSNLLTAAKAFVTADRKHSAQPVAQGEFPL